MRSRGGASLKSACLCLRNPLERESLAYPTPLYPEPIYCQEKPTTRTADTRPTKMSVFGSGGMELVDIGFKSILNMRMC
jgi:hypothetical protein